MARKITQTLEVPTQETCYSFYILTKETLVSIASQRGIDPSDLERYYSHTDQYCEFYTDPNLSEKSKIFAQMLFHAQNATMISSIVKFKENERCSKK